MKHVKFLVVLVSMMFFMAGCEDDKIVTADQLPAAAKAYIQTNQPGASIVFIKKDKEMFSTKYQVQLDNHVEIEFDGDGQVIDMDMND